MKRVAKKKHQWTVEEINDIPEEELRARWREYRCSGILLKAAGQLPIGYTRIDEYLYSWAADELVQEHDQAWTVEWSTAYKRFRQVALEEAS